MADTERRAYATEIMEEIKALREAVSAVTLNQTILEQVLKGVIERDNESKTKIDVLTKIVITGNGVPSLQENMRTMAKTLNTFMAEATQDREEEHARRKEEAKQKAERVYAEHTRWKWLVIGFIVTIIPACAAFVYQFVTFWTQVVPNLR